MRLGNVGMRLGSVNEVSGGLEMRSGGSCNEVRGEGLGVESLCQLRLECM